MAWEFALEAFAFRQGSSPDIRGGKGGLLGMQKMAFLSVLLLEGSGIVLQENESFKFKSDALSGWSIDGVFFKH